MYPAVKKDEVASFSPRHLFVFDAPLYPTYYIFPMCCEDNLLSPNF